MGTITVYLLGEDWFREVVAMALFLISTSRAVRSMSALHPRNHLQTRWQGR
jgi:hypothetical protein